MNFFKKSITVILLVCFSYLGMAENSNWTKWRGPSANGSSPETNWNPSDLSLDSILWTSNVGKGHSAVVVKDSRLYTLGNYHVKDSSYKDVIVCLDTKNGKQIWVFEYSCLEYEDPGPFASPLLYQNKLYTISRKGDLYCLNAENGKLIWHVNLKKQNYVDDDDEFASSPVAHKNLIILNQNHHGIAFNAENGILIWNSPKEKSAMSTPVLFDLNAETFMLSQNDKSTVLVNPETGKMFWEIEFNSIADPIIEENTMIIPHWKAFRKYEISKENAKLIWKHPDPKSSFQSFVEHQGYIYGFSNNRRFQCISTTDGSLKWSKMMKEGALITANKTLIILNQEGKLIMAEPNPIEFKEIKSIQAINNPKSVQTPGGNRRISGCWTNPVLANGVLYLRNTYGVLVSIKLN